MYCLVCLYSFTDDAVITYTSKSKNWNSLKVEIQDNFKNIKKWFQLNELTLNTDRTKYLSFTLFLNDLSNFSLLIIE